MTAKKVVGMYDLHFNVWILNEPKNKQFDKNKNKIKKKKNVK